MPCLRPATPGFIVTLTATILLAIVSFNVPIIKSVYFLRASLTVDNVNGSISLGTLGYCIELSSNGTTCSSPSVGYAFDPNALLGDSISFAQIPTVVVKWITYALFLHVIALCGAAISALFGLLAHVREMSMTCCSTCISGFAAVIALVAFIFDIVLFFVVKARVKSIGGTATFGNAVWLTLAAWVMLFFSGCFYAFGRCCVRRRPRGPDGRLDDSWAGKFNNGADSHADQMRLDAVKAEADRKARQKNEVGLPAFPEHADIVRPLNDMGDESDEEARPYRDQHAIGTGMAGPRRQGSAQTYRGGYAQASPGTRAVDEYYSPSSPTRSNTGDANTGYPPSRAYSSNSNNPQSMYNSTPPANTAAMAVGAAAAGGAAAYLSPGQSRHGQYPSGVAYGHASGGTSYHTAASSPHQSYPSAYSQYDPYSQTQTQTQPQQSTFNADSYNQTAAIPGAYGSSSSATPPPRQPSQPYADPYYSSSTAAQQQRQSQTYGDYSNYNTAYGNDDPFSSGANTTTANNNNNNYGYGAATGAAVAYQSPLDQHQRQNLQPERSYTLGGGGYGANVVPDVSGSASAYGARVVASSPPPMPSAPSNINTAVGGAGGVMGPRSPGSASHYAQGQGEGRGEGHSSYEDSPPGYDASAGASVHVPAWGSKA